MEKKPIPSNNQDFVLPQVEQAKPVFIKNGCELIAVRPEDVSCLKANGNNCEMYLKNDKSPKILGRTYSSLMDSIIGKHLLQVRRGASINLFYIKKVEGTEITMMNGMNLNISQNHIKEFLSLVEIV